MSQGFVLGEVVFHAREQLRFLDTHLGAMSRLLRFRQLSESRFVLGALRRRNKFANSCHDLMKKKQLS